MEEEAQSFYKCACNPFLKVGIWLKIVITMTWAKSPLIALWVAWVTVEAIQLQNMYRACTLTACLQLLAISSTTSLSLAGVLDDKGEERLYWQLKRTQNLQISEIELKHIFGYVFSFFTQHVYELRIQIWFIKYIIFNCV